jgi:peptide/nickel transport system permease protein
MKAAQESSLSTAAPAPASVPTATAPRPHRRRSWLSMIGLALVLFWLLMALIGPTISPYDAAAIVDVDVFGGISSKFWLGTDYLGRDMLSRILFGTRYTIGLALAATLLASSVGTTLALFAALAGGWIDAVISRTLDALISIPSKMFALMMVATFGSSVWLLILTAAITYMPGAYRIARSLAVNVQAMEYVQAARARGEGAWYITCVEMLPNMIRPVLADLGLRFVDADWGSLVRENISGLGEGATAVIMPALAIASLTIGVNLLIDNLRGKRARKD